MSIRAAVSLVVATLVAIGLFWGGNALYDAGYAARDAIAQKELSQARGQQLTEQTTGIQDARKTDIELQAKATETKKASKKRASELDAVMTAQERTPYQPPKDPANEPKPLVGQSVLDVFTLCLLNAERAGEPSPGSACAPGRTDDEVRAAAATPTEVGGGDLARSDQEVARLYNDLAWRHDGLVDWVDRCVLKIKGECNGNR